MEMAGLPPGRYDVTLRSYGQTNTESRREIDTAIDKEIDTAKDSRELVPVTGTIQFDDAKLTSRAE
jgi:hypothetical protein